MVCTSCGRAAKAGARFCVGCGGSLALRCPACGAESEPDGRFCAACGAAVVAGPPTAAVARKVVTIVFADLIGSTALQERLDPESVSRIMEGYHAAVRAPIEAHGGTVVQLLGDGVMCAFGVPRVAEDDALRAVRAAVEVQRSFRDFMSEHPELAGRVGLRVAVNTGEVVVSDDYAAGIGDPLNVAARLQQEAKDGDVLIGEATQRLVAERVTLERVGSFALKGRAEPVTAYRVVSLERPAGVAATSCAASGRSTTRRSPSLPLASRWCSDRLASASRGCWSSSGGGSAIPRP
jgi:class 3 adenylate cyclase